MPYRELIGVSGFFVGGWVLLAWVKLRLWDWQACREQK